MNPYEQGMVSVSNLFALSSLDGFEKKHRTINEAQYMMFFNPMWSFLGKYSKYQGSYYYSTPTDHNHWNTFDQFVISPSLIDKLIPNIRI